MDVFGFVAGFGCRTFFGKPQPQLSLNRYVYYKIYGECE